MMLVAEVDVMAMVWMDVEQRGYSAPLLVIGRAACSVYTRPMIVLLAPRRSAAFLALLYTIGLIQACAVNPATGERQLSLISETQEVRMGREAAANVQAMLGFVQDRALQSYVQRIGKREAAISERPKLPWEFHVVDDPTPNAFALPGGFIYVTRGMMSLMTSEAQLAAVLGHEIGHVTARDSVNQLSKQQLAALGLGLGGIFFPEARPFGSLVGAGLDLLFLKYSRDDERQADELGFEYMRKRGYDVSKIADVFRALKRTADQQQSGLPGWLSTHPLPDERIKNAETRAASLDRQSNARVGREDYLRQIDDLVYGKDPRDGFFRERTFYHPTLRFRVSFPDGWRTDNLARAVVAVAPGNRAALQLTIAGNASPEVAMRRFIGQPDVAVGRTVHDNLHREPAVIAEFQARTEQGVVQGLAAFIWHADSTYQLVGYTPASLYSQYAAVMESAIRSFGPINDPAILNVQPQRIDIVQVDASITVSEFARRFDSVVPAPTLAILNQVPTADSRLSAGILAKRVIASR